MALILVTVQYCIVMSNSQNQHQNSPNYGFIHLVAPVVEKGQGVPPAALPSSTDQFEPVTIDVTEQEGYVKK